MKTLRPGTTQRNTCNALAKVITHSILLLATALGLSACLAVADRAVNEDLKSLGQEFKVFEADAALFRRCLSARGGSCRGATANPLPHSSQHRSGDALTPNSGGTSDSLAAAMTQLPAGDPARTAFEVLDHPVVGQATALHDHLRGMPAADTAGVAVEQGEDGSTITLSMKLRQMWHFHDLLLGSIGTTAWEALSGRCAALLERHRDESDLPALEADCRRAEFIRAYLGAYFRRGQFVGVDVELAGAIQALDDSATQIEAKITAVLDQLDPIRTDLQNIQNAAAVGASAGEVGSDLKGLIDQLQADISAGFGAGAAAIFADLTGLGDQVERQSSALADATSASVIRPLAGDLAAALSGIEKQLGRLSDLVGGVDQKLVGDINDGLNRANAALSNVFKVSTVGFLSRDLSFQARLPTLEVTLDPTARHLLTLTDVDTGQLITGSTDLGQLGVVTDQSGVGTGASIGAEVVRVFLEAVFDAHEGLPALAPVGQSLRATGLTLGDYSLPLYTAPMGNVDATDLSRMTNFNDSVAASTRIISGRIISGIGPLSLNNPPLENLIVEIITTSVRKAAEKASWCWYACDLDVQLKALESDAGKALADEADAVSERVRTAAERVGLRLHLAR